MLKVSSCTLRGHIWMPLSTSLVTKLLKSDKNVKSQQLHTPTIHLDDTVNLISITKV